MQRGPSGSSSSSPESIFTGVQFVLSNFDSVSEAQYRSELVYRGGTDVGRYDSSCSHVIVCGRVYVITATAMQIQSLICLREVLARICFSESVEISDVTEAFRLLEVAMQQSTTDHNTGSIDMDLIMTGISVSERTRRESLVVTIGNLVMEKMKIGGPSTPVTVVNKLKFVVVMFNVLVLYVMWLNFWINRIC